MAESGVPDLIQLLSPSLRPYRAKLSLDGESVQQEDNNSSNFHNF